MENDDSKQFHESFIKASDALDAINELNKLDLSEIHETDLEKILNDKFRWFPITHDTIPAGTELFRARVNINRQPFNKVADIFAPPSDCIMTYGRANRQGERIFYCASNYKLATLEVVQWLKKNRFPNKEIVFLTMGIWRTKVDLNVACIIDSPILHETRSDINEFYKEVQKSLNRGDLSQDLVNANNLISKFFSDQFTKDNISSHHDYKISALYTSTIKEGNNYIAPQFKNEKFDGINYPSVAMKYQGDNQALFIETAQDTNKLEIINAIQLMCYNIDFENGDFMDGTLHEAQEISNGIIKWKEEIYKPKTPS
ncbi:MAG: hypothetical protein V4620_10780 [Bacteroidota bacterium]